MHKQAALFAALALACVLAVNAEVYYKEDFSASNALDSWIQSSKNTQGKIELGKGEINAGTDAEQGLVCTEDMKHYTTSTAFKAPFSNKGKTLVFQYQAKLAKKFDCGGAYLKLHPKGFDQKTMDGDTPYSIMFGPDHCGYSTKKIHAIFNYKGKNLEKKEEVKIEYNEKDEFSHLYTLVVNSDNTYEILFDQKSKVKGNLADHWDFLLPKEIDDPEDKKPADWVDEAKIADPEDKKPEGYDDIPKQIKDPKAAKPDDWDDESDGEWEAPMIDNPDYKGEWKQKMIDNPAYKGVWAPKKIPNPDFKDDENLYLYEDIAGVSIETWNVNGGTLYDNIIVTDSLEEANKFAEETFKGLADKEKKVKEEADKAEADKKAAEEAAKKKDEKKDDDDDEDDDDEDDKPEKKEEKKEEL